MKAVTIDTIEEFSELNVIIFFHDFIWSQTIQVVTGCQQSSVSLYRTPLSFGYGEVMKTNRLSFIISGSAGIFFTLFRGYHLGEMCLHSPEVQILWMQ